MTAELSNVDRTGPDHDIVVVGAGLGGVYAAKRFTEAGLSVVGFEAAADVGGVWFHNRYPGARVDVECYFYCYFFDPQLFREWTWPERYPAQADLLAYIGHVADRYDVRKLFTFNSPVTAVQWDPVAHQYRVETGPGLSVTARFVVMATGNLSKARDLRFPGLADFQGEWLRTSHWPERPVPLAGRRVGVIGTGSSGVQTITAIAPEVEHLTVFQRNPHYACPARNGAIDAAKHAAMAADVPRTWAEILADRGGGGFPMGTTVATDLSPEEQRERLEYHWAWGGQAMVTVFLDQGVNRATNTLVSDFVRDRTRERVADAELAEKLLPAYPIGTRRVAVDVGYYETYNRDNVSLVDLRADPVDRITATGIRLRSGVEHELDLIIFATGFEAFKGALDQAGIRNEEGRQPSDYWGEGPRTFLGLMTRRFPNLFHLTGPGSPSVLSNMFAHNVQHADVVADLVAHMAGHGYTRVEPSERAQDWWSEHVQEVAKPLIRRQEDNYMVHVNADGTRRFIPYVGGFNRFVQACEQVAQDGYEDFEFK